MKLLELMLKEEVTWPVGACVAVQDYDRELKFGSSDVPLMTESGKVWIDCGFIKGLMCTSLADDWQTRIITREEWQQEREKMQKQQEYVSAGDIYLSRKGFRFAVIGLAKSGSDCSIDMVVYVNLDATNDFPPGQNWVLDSRSFKSKFKIDGGSKQEVNNSWHERGELPPVGCECWHILEGRKVFIVAKHCSIDAVIFSSYPGAGELFYGYDSDFRPIRTERENAIDDISSYFCDADGFQVTPHATDLIAARIYDAGYRKAKS